MSQYDVVLHVDKADGSLAVALGNAVNYALALPGGNFRMVLVVNSVAVRELTTDNAAIREALERAGGHGLSIRVCNNALKAQGIAPERLYPQCAVVPAGLVEVVHLQRNGYAYIKV